MAKWAWDSLLVDHRPNHVVRLHLSSAIPSAELSDLPAWCRYLSMLSRTDVNDHFVDVKTGYGFEISF